MPRGDGPLRWKELSRAWLDLPKPIATCLLAVAWLSPVLLWAENNSNYIFNATTTNFGGPFYLPTTGTGTNNSLQILNGGSVTNTEARIGNNPGDNYNYAIVSSNGSSWYNSGQVYIGYSGAFGQLTVTNGGRIDTLQFNLGFGIAASNNAALVTGANSLITTPNGTVLGGGGNNSLTIADGGRVQNNIGYFGFGGLGGNSVLVTGAGSVWTNTGVMYVGYTDNNVLTIANSGFVYSVGAQLGNTAAGTNNVVVVTGAGSLWNPVGPTIGYVSSGNRLIITNGGTVLDGGANVGTYQNNNMVTVTGPGSVWSNTANINIGYGGVGQTAAGNQLIIANSGRVENTYAYIGLDVGASNNSVTVTGPGSVWNNSQHLVIGNGDKGNSLTIANGGRVNNTDGYFGNGSSNASVTVSGTNSLWNNTGILYLGNYGKNSALTITNGGKVAIGGITYVGYQVGSDGHQILVTGDGSQWTNSNVLYMGYNSVGSQLTIANSGRVDTLQLQLGLGVAAVSNTVTVTGPGSLLNTAGGVVAGGGGYQQLIVTNGGKVQAAGISYWGFSAAGSGNNSAMVTGSGSVWTNSNIMYIGYSENNRLTIANSGFVYSASASLGQTAGGTSNMVVVTDPGSLWNPVGATIGDHSVGNQAIITNGGRVTTVGLTIGNNVGGAFNSVTVTGTGSAWTNTGDINVGYFGRDNQLIVSGGGRVDNAGTLFVGNQAGSSNNSITVTGSGSLLNSAGTYLFLGNGGVNSRLTVSDGGELRTVQGIIGHGSSNATATVTGSSAQWNNSSDFFVGNYAGSATLIISNGGHVAVGGTGYTGYQGGNPGNNRVIVTGTGSLWTNTGPLYVGYNGAGDSLTVSDGGRVEAPGGFNIGVGVASTRDSVTVSGNGARVNTPAVAFSGSGANQLTIGSGGTVQSSAIYWFSGANTALVTGANAVWTNNGPTYMGYTGNDVLVISNGGYVYTLGASIGMNGVTGGNKVIVTGSGSTWNPVGPSVGYVGPNNELIVTNGGTVLVAGGMNVGYDYSAQNARVTITGPGSIVQSGGTITVGSNNVTSFGSGRIDITDGGTLETVTLVGGNSGSGIVSNRQGVYQFSTATPVVTPNTTGGISLSNGTISYRGVLGADINNAQVANITRTGDNTFRLNNSTNALVSSYTFESSAITGDPTIYQRLQLTNHSQWHSTSLIIGTNGVVAGGSGDLVNIDQYFLIHSTNRFAFNLVSGGVLFDGTGHTNAITGNDLGAGSGGYDNNFAYGELHIGTSSDTICFESGNGAASNALYIGWLDLLGSTNLVANLHAPTSINLYYLDSGHDARNAYLNNATYQLLDCNGATGGFLIPAVPEPSSFLLILLTTCGVLARRHRVMAAFARGSASTHAVIKD